VTIEPSPAESAPVGTAPEAGPPTSDRVRGQCARHPERPAKVQCSRCGDNLCDGCAAERVEGVCKSCLELLSNRGKVWQVQWLAVVTMVHGGLLLLWAIGLVVSGLYLGVAMGGVETTQPDAPPPEFMAGVFGGATLFMAFGQLVPGVLQLAAGWYMLSFRYRPLAIVAFLAGLSSITGCYCLPTSILLAIWGLIVIFDRDVGARFAASA
jgi:hypothetical protein